LQAISGSQWQAGRAAKQAAFLARKAVLVFIGVDQTVALIGRQVAHASDRLVDGFPAVGRQLLELLKELTRLLLLTRRQVLPGFHALQHAFLLLRWQVGEALQSALQALLLLGRKLPELGVILQFAALLLGRQISIVAEPVASVPGLILDRTGLSGTVRIRTNLIRVHLIGAN